MSLADGVLACIPGDMAFSAELHAILRERFPVEKMRAESAEVGRRFGRWCCPGDGAPLNADAECAQCGQSLRDLLSSLAEHPHCDEATALKYEADLETARRRFSPAANKPKLGPFERYTDCARTVMRLANQEAQRFGSPFLGTEHLLLGLSREDRGVAALALKNLGVGLERLRESVGGLVESESELATLRHLPFTPRASRAIEDSLDRARLWNHLYVGTEHMLLGLLRDPENTAVQVLSRLGLHPDAIRLEVCHILGKETD